MLILWIRLWAMETNKDFQKILDTFSALDGGVSFVNLKILVEDDTKIGNKVLKDMVKLIDAGNKIYGNKP